MHEYSITDGDGTDLPDGPPKPPPSQPDQPIGDN